MFALRKTTLAILVLSNMGNIPVIWAGEGYDKPKSYKADKGYFIGIDALYLQPRNGDLDFAYASSQTGNVLAQSTINLNPDYSWGFNLFGGVTFTENNEIRLAWQRLHTKDTNSTYYESQPRWILSDWPSVNGRVTFDYDEVSAVFAHTHIVSDKWRVRYGAGVNYAKINSDLAVDGLQERQDQNVWYGRTGHSDFNGVGPRIEANIFYDLTQHVTLFADGNTALLIGNRGVSLDSTDSDFTYTFADRHVTVPKLGLRLGLNYTNKMGLIGGEGSMTLFTLEAGWQAETYIDAIERPVLGPVGGESDAASVFSQTSNFSNQGPFLGIKVSTDSL